MGCAGAQCFEQGPRALRADACREGAPRAGAGRALPWAWARLRPCLSSHFDQGLAPMACGTYLLGLHTTNIAGTRVLAWACTLVGRQGIQGSADKVPGAAIIRVNNTLVVAEIV